MLEDELKKTFEQLNIQPQPRTFGAVDIVYRGIAVKRRRRTYAVAATGTGTAVVAVVIAFALSQPPNQDDNSPAGPPLPGTSAPVRTSPTTTTDDPASSSVENPVSTTPETTSTTSPDPTPTTTHTRPTAPGTTARSTGAPPLQTTTG